MHLRLSHPYLSWTWQWATLLTRCWDPNTQHSSRLRSSPHTLYQIHWHACELLTFKGRPGRAACHQLHSEQPSPSHQHPFTGFPQRPLNGAPCFCSGPRASSSPQQADRSLRNSHLSVSFPGLTHSKENVSVATRRKHTLLERLSGPSIIRFPPASHLCPILTSIPVPLGPSNTLIFHLGMLTIILSPSLSF